MFRKRGGIAILVNGDESHLDILEQILINPQRAAEIAGAHHPKAHDFRIRHETHLSLPGGR